MHWTLPALFVASFFAGAMNALAGGGSFVTFPALLLTGLDPRAANITSTVALFPGQIATSWSGRALVSGAGRMPFAGLFVISLGGGVVGALLLLATPPSFFAAMVPYLVLFATSVFAWGSFLRRPKEVEKPRDRYEFGSFIQTHKDDRQNKGLEPDDVSTQHYQAPGTRVTGLAQLGIAIYGGYFGGGIGFLMLAALTVAGVAIRRAGATKNALAAAINAAAAAVFLFAPDVAWMQTAIVAVGSVGGGLAGAWILKRVNEKLLRGFVVLVGLALTVGLFLRG